MLAIQKVSSIKRKTTKKTMNQTLKFPLFYCLFYLGGMCFHFLFQKISGDVTATTNLFVVFMSILAITSIMEFREKLRFLTVFITSVLVALLSTLTLLLLSIISDIVGFSMKAESASLIETIMTFLGNFAIAIILLRLGNRHWGFTRNLTAEAQTTRSD